ncbi:hypothetical protein FACS189419_03610 [Planctomycetales bacterium]|nr:hypothetical protein FACS189419_03610 [Planctomycetales bacterium]
MSYSKAKVAKEAGKGFVWGGLLAGFSSVATGAGLATATGGGLFGSSLAIMGATTTAVVAWPVVLSVATVGGAVVATGAVASEIKRQRKVNKEFKDMCGDKS